MKTILALAALLIPQDSPKQEFKVPETKAGEKGWENYIEPPMYDAEKAKDLAPGLDTPEAAVVHFYASRLRGDEKWKEALPPKDKWSKTLIRKLQELDTWTFKKMRLVGRMKDGDSLWYIKIYLEIELAGGKKDSGKDDATVEKIDGKWYVTRPPT